MTTAFKKTSDKLNIIDQTAFESYQHDEAHSEQKAIRNSKYKKTRTSFNLMQFLKQKPKKCKTSKLGRKTASSGATRGKLVITAFNLPKKKRGKQREGGRKNHHSRLKKAILRYRKQKRQTQQLYQSIDEATEKLNALEIVTSGTALPIQKAELTKPSGIHSLRFRNYCDNCTTTRLHQISDLLLRELNRFQLRALGVNEIKARAHRRFVLGFREVQNFMTINKVKLLLIAPDCEVCSGEAGIDETIASLKNQCRDKNIPYLFSLRRRELAYALYKKVPVSCVGILNYDGAHEVFTQLIEELGLARSAYQKLLQSNIES